MSIEDAKTAFFNEQRIAKLEAQESTIHDLRRAALAALKLVPQNELASLLAAQPRLVTLAYVAIKRYNPS